MGQEAHQSREIQNLGTVAEFLAAQIDAAAALVEESRLSSRPPSKARLLTILTLKQLSVADFNERTQCGAALASIGMSIGLTVGSAPTGPVGWTLAGANLLADVYAAEVDCGSPIRNGVRQMDETVDGWYSRMARFQKRMEIEITRLYAR